MTGRRSKVEQNLTEEQRAYLDSAFAYHPPPSDDIRNMHQQLRDSHRGLAAMLLHLPPGREASLALTKLEEAVMWGNAAIARNHEAITKNLAEQRGRTE